jgi:hypothetical protein
MIPHQQREGTIGRKCYSNFVRLHWRLYYFFMTTINKSTDIPSDIVTLEQLAIWSNNCLYRLYPEVTGIEGLNNLTKSIQSGDYPIDGTVVTRHIGRHSIELDPDYSVGNKKTWMYAKDLGTKTLTADMKSN